MAADQKYRDGGFEDNRHRMFGRGLHLVHLRQRAERPGLTAVVGRPKQGKSWVLRETCRTLYEFDGHLVGYTESKGETRDLLLRATVDLYRRWLESSSFVDRARVVWKQQRQDLLSRFGEGVGKAFEGILELAVPEAKGLGAAVEQVFSGLAAANRDLKTGAVILEPLKYDQASALVRLLGDLTDRPITLVIDAWEQSPDVEAEKKLVDAILNHPDEWPRVHVFIGLRPDRPPIDYVNQLAQDPAAEVYDLPDMEFEKVAERRRLVKLLHEELPVTRDLSDDDLIQLIDGYPGALYHWMHPANREQIHSRDDLAALVNDALKQRYGEFDQLLAPLAAGDGPAYALALRLALLHGLSGREEWDCLAPVVLADGNTEPLGRLQQLGVLEAGDFPSYGHATRHEFVRNWFLARPDTLTLRGHTEELVRGLAAKIKNGSPDNRSASLGLLALGEFAEVLDLPDDLRLLCMAPRALLSDLGLSAFKADLLLRRAQTSAQCYPEAAALIAMASFNALYYAKQENDLGRRNALLDELRALEAQHSSEATVREYLANGLFNTLTDAEEEGDQGRRDELLDELRAVDTRHPHDAAVRDKLAMGLVNTLVGAKHEGDIRRRGLLLEELRNLHARDSGDMFLREQLAKGLFNALNHPMQEEGLGRRDALLDELRGLQSQHPDDAAVREPLARGLLNTMNDAKRQEKLGLRDALLDELRALRRQHSDDAAVRERLAQGLFNTLIDAKERGDGERTQELRAELQSLLSAGPSTKVLNDVARRLAHLGD